jgi:hypothetical protein
LLLPPGKYSARLEVGGKQLTQPLEVRKDPNSGGTEAEIEQQLKTLREIRRSIEQSAALLNRIELVRGQLVQLKRVVDDSEIRGIADEIERKLMDVEQNLMELRLTGRGQDGVRFGARLHSKLIYLANGLMSGDFRPTDQQLEVQKELQDSLQRAAGDSDALMKGELSRFNDVLRKRSFPTLHMP